MTSLKHRGEGFTLVELMVVVGLIGLISLFAVPAFQESNRGGRSRTAVFQLNTAVSLARQTAITSRQDVYVLFPDDVLPLTTNTVDLAYRAFALYGERDGYLGDWRRLPDGVVFHHELDESRLGINVFVDNETAQVPFPAQTSGNLQEVLAWTFRPDGTMPGTSRHSAFVTEGYVETTGHQVQNVARRPGTTVFGIEVLAVSGQARMREYNHL